MSDQIERSNSHVLETGGDRPGCKPFLVRVDGELFQVDMPEISASEVLILAGKQPPDWCLFMRCKSGLIHVEPEEAVDLTMPGVERFRTRRALKLCIEDKTFNWCKRTITTEEIADLGGWDVSQGVIEVDDEQNERTLSPGEVVELRPGRKFGKKHCWKRG